MTLTPQPAKSDVAAAEEISRYTGYPASHSIARDYARIIARHAQAERNDLAAAKAKADEMEARCVSLCLQLPPETLGGQVQKWRDEYLAERAAAEDLANLLRLARVYFPTQGTLTRMNIDSAISNWERIKS